MKKIAIISALILSTFFLSAQINHAMRDEYGRHVIGRGYVVVTNNSYFNSDDYLRMVRLGANYQVIRLELGKLSTFPGASLDPNYLLKLDTLVNLAKDAGMKTVFKMTVYGVKSVKWEDFWVNKNNMQQTYLDAWKVIWNRYKDEDFVTGYDLLNEPRKMLMDISYNDLTTNYLIPVYQKLIDESQKINPDKKCLVQAIFVNKGEKVNDSQYAELKGSLDRSNVMYAPHIYMEHKHLLKPILTRFDKESKAINAPVFIGEWGFLTFEETDTTITGRFGQLNYMDFYMRTAELIDSLGFNTIKAWFSGTPQMYNFGSPATFAIFSDKNEVGNVERKYITDIIARPYPQAIAGDINSFKYNFATRTLSMNITSDNSKGASQIFIGANRHYPDGFSVVINDSFILCHNPLKRADFEVFKSVGTSNPSDFIWDENKQQLIIQKWPIDKSKLSIQIKPGVFY